MISELTMQSFEGFSPSVYRIFHVLERAKRFFGVVAVQIRRPLPCIGALSHALYSGCIMFVDWMVCVVLRSCRFAKVIPSGIAFIAVAMVDFILWKNAGHVKPSKNVRVYNSPINADLYISSFTDPRSVQENRGRAWLPL